MDIAVAQDRLMRKLLFEGTQAEAQEFADHIEAIPAIASWPLSLYHLDGRWAAELLIADAQQDAQALAFLKARLAEAGLSARVQWADVADIDWVTHSLQRLSPIRIGRYFIHGAHDRHQRKSGKINIEIDAAQAFGTGHHATTRLCLVALERVQKILASKHDLTLLDLGCGSGVLAIAAAKSFPVSCIASDIDPVAVKIARENAIGNHIAPYIKFLVAEGVHASEIRQSAPFNVMLVNILLGPVLDYAPAIAGVSAQGSILILSGFLASDRRRILGRYRAFGFIPSAEWVSEGWLCLMLIRNG